MEIISFTLFLIFCLWAVDHIANLLTEFFFKLSQIVRVLLILLLLAVLLNLYYS